MEDGIQAVSTRAEDLLTSALTIDGSRDIYIENLQLLGGPPGDRQVGAVLVSNSGPIIRFVNTTMESDFFALFARDAEVVVQDSVVGPGRGIFVRGSSFFNCRRCTIDVDGRILDANRGSRAVLSESTATGDSGVSARNTSTASVNDTAISVNGGQAISAQNGSIVNVTRGTLDGFIRVSDKSEVELAGVQQVLPSMVGNRNRVDDDSYLRASDERGRVSSPLETSIISTNFSTFSKGFFGSSVDGVSCDSTTDAFCASSSTSTSSSCFLCPVCGDGFISSGEECEDFPPNTAAGDGCSPSCTIEQCGNFILDFGETCDDGNNDPGDSCSSDCSATGPGPLGCGNGSLEPSEECDDGNTGEGDGCSPVCTIERCGNGIVEPFLDEDCELGEDGCSPTCTEEICGNRILDVGEECDDGNAEDADNCSNTCVRNFCGDGTTQPLRGEQCDDGNFLNADDCSPFCAPN